MAGRSSFCQAASAFSAAPLHGVAASCRSGARRRRCPNCPSARCRRRSPRTRSNGMLSTSAAICAMTVWLPWPHVRAGEVDDGLLDRRSAAQLDAGVAVLLVAEAEADVLEAGGEADATARCGLRMRDRASLCIQPFGLLPVPRLILRPARRLGRRDDRLRQPDAARDGRADGEQSSRRSGCSSGAARPGPCPAPRPACPSGSRPQSGPAGPPKPRNAAPGTLLV